MRKTSTGLPAPVVVAQCGLDDAGVLRVASGHVRIAAFYDLCPDGVLVMGAPSGHVEVTRDLAAGGLKGRDMQTGAEYPVHRSDGSAFQFQGEVQCEADSGPEPERPRL